MTKSSDGSNERRQPRQFGLSIVKSCEPTRFDVFPSAVRTIIGSTQQRSTASSTAWRAALSFAVHHCIEVTPAKNTATGANRHPGRRRHA